MLQVVLQNHYLILRYIAVSPVRDAHGRRVIVYNMGMCALLCLPLVFLGSYVSASLVPNVMLCVMFSKI